MKLHRKALHMTVYEGIIPEKKTRHMNERFGRLKDSISCYFILKNYTKIDQTKRYDAIDHLYILLEGR